MRNRLLSASFIVLVTITTSATPVFDASNRPHYLLEGYEPLPELV